MAWILTWLQPVDQEGSSLRSEYENTQTYAHAHTLTCREGYINSVVLVGFVSKKVECLLECRMREKERECPLGSLCVFLMRSLCSWRRERTPATLTSILISNISYHGNPVSLLLTETVTMVCVWLCVQVRKRLSNHTYCIEDMKSVWGSRLWQTEKYKNHTLPHLPTSSLFFPSFLVWSLYHMY